MCKVIINVIIKDKRNGTATVLRKKQGVPIDIYTRYRYNVYRMIE